MTLFIQNVPEKDQDKYQLSRNSNPIDKQIQQLKDEKYFKYQKDD